MRSSQLVLRAGGVLVVLAVLSGGACASDKYAPPRTTWDQAETSGTAVPAESAATAAAKEDKRSAADVALELPDARSCVEAAMRYGGEKGVALIRECMHRSDFIDLPGVLADPWLAHMKTQPTLQARLVEVMARRGGFLEADLTRVSKSGVPMYSLDAALKNPAAMAGQLVVVRGNVLGVKSEKWGTAKGLVAEIEELTWVTDDAPTRNGQVGFEDIDIPAPEKTGRTIFVRVEKREQLRRAADVVVLMTFEGPRKYKTEDGDDEDSGIGMFKAAFDASPTLRY